MEEKLIEEIGSLLHQVSGELRLNMIVLAFEKIEKAIKLMDDYRYSDDRIWPD